MAVTQRLTFRGLRRQLLRKLQHALLSVEKMDLRETILASSRGVDPTLFIDGEDSPEATAWQLLSDRVDTCLTAKS